MRWLPLAPLCSWGSVYASDPVNLGTRLEPLVDRFLIERLDGARLKLHEPVPAGVALRFDQPWEGVFCGYVTVLKDESVYRMYYRGNPQAGRDGSPTEVTAYAESADGIQWTKPKLRLFEVQGTLDNNVILADQPPFSHNFSPFLDAHPGVPAGERYKALAGTSASGLFGFVSGDGIHWRKLQDQPLLTEGAFDSQNVAFWSAHEGCSLYFAPDCASSPGPGGASPPRSKFTRGSERPSGPCWSTPRSGSLRFHS